jgi:hypothetical protein
MTVARLADQGGPTQARSAAGLSCALGRVSRAATSAALIVALSALLLIACQPTTPTAPASAATADVPAQAPPPALPLAQVLARVQSEIAALKAVAGLHHAAGGTLGGANAKLQTVGYFRRIPSHPTPTALASNLRAAAGDLGLSVVSLDIADDPRGLDDKEPLTLGPHDRWQPTTDDLLGRQTIRIGLRGPRAAIVGFIDELPRRVERLVCVKGHQPLAEAPGLGAGELLIAEAYFERNLPIPKTELNWPPLADWLRAAGHDPDSPATAALPGYEALAKAVTEGRAIAPDARLVMASINDMPRWPARANALAEVTEQVLGVRGEVVLSAPAAP